MSDHVALSIEQIVQSGKCTESEAEDEASNSLSGSTSGSKMSCSTAACVVEDSGRLTMICDQEIEAHEMNAVNQNTSPEMEVRKVGLGIESKVNSSCTNGPFDVVDVADEETLPLLKGDNDSVDCRHIVVPVETGPQIGQKDIESLTFAECRICQEEDTIANLEAPCACSGSLKFAHRKCIQHWCNEKGDTLCEICQKPFEGGYSTPQQGGADNLALDMGMGWDIASGQPRLFALAADHHFLEGDYEEYAGSHAHSAACFRSVALILVALLLLRHIISMTGVGEDEDLTTFFMLFLVRAAGFLIPCYIMARAMNALQIRRQQQEAAIAAAAEVTHLIQTGRIQAVVATAEP